MNLEAYKHYKKPEIIIFVFTELTLQQLILEFPDFKDYLNFDTVDSNIVLSLLLESKTFNSNSDWKKAYN